VSTSGCYGCRNKTLPETGSWTYDVPLSDDVDDLRVRVRMRGTFAIQHHPLGYGA